MPANINLLLFTHSETDALPIRQCLELAGYVTQITQAKTRAELETALAKPHDLVLGDPELDGITLGEMLSLLRASQHHAPFIAFSPDMPHQRGTAAVLAGAYDYCSEADLERLPSMVHRAQRNAKARIESEQIKAMHLELFNNSREAIAILDDHSCVQDINAAFETLFGYDPGEVRGRPIHELIVPKEKFDEHINIAARIYQGKITRMESTRRSKSGQMLRVSAIGIPVELEGGTRGVYAIYSDISARMRAMDALRRAESNYRNVFMNALEGMYVSTPLGRFVLANTALAELLGYDSPSEITDSVRSIGREIYTDPAHRERFLNAMCESDTLWRFLSRVRRKDGTELDVLENVRAIRDDDGELLYYQGTMSQA